MMVHQTKEVNKTQFNTIIKPFIPTLADNLIADIFYKYTKKDRPR